MKFGTVVHLGLLSGSTLKFLIFELSKMAVATILKITKIAISQQQFNQSSQNLVMQNGLVNCQSHYKI